MKPVKLTAHLVENFAGLFLSHRYDNPVPVAEFHREGWALYTGGHAQCMVIAPRDHAKSTALTFAYIMAEVCFRSSDYVILIGSTEDMAAEQLSNIREELDQNEDLREEFLIEGFEQDSKTDIIVRCRDGHRFRILARGAEQKIRGKMWKGKRPNLMVCDDMEDDEQVENDTRRVKFRKWFFRAAKQALSRTGKIRVHGTILHDDSLLSRLRKNKVWKHLFFKAHRSFSDFSGILWPVAWTEQRLRARQQEFIEDGDAAGYSQEFLNDPVDNAQAYLRKSDFLPLSDADYQDEVHYGAGQKLYVGCDFAVSKNDLANRTAFVVGGRGLGSRVNFIDFRADRWATDEWIEEMFSIAERYSPDWFFVEDGVIWKSVERMIYNEMRLRGLFFNIEALASVTDKASRGRPFQKRTRAGACYFNKQHENYSDYELECSRFTGRGDKADDYFDSSAILIRGLELLPELEEEDFDPDEVVEMRRMDPRAQQGRNELTGY